jgi:glutamine synthetase
MATGDRTAAATPGAAAVHAAARQEAARLSAAGVSVVALTTTDTAGVVRVKAVPVERLADAAVRGVGISPVFDVFTPGDAITATDRLGGPDGDLRMVPDLRRLTVLAAQPGWAWAPADRYAQDGSPHPGCSRHALRRAVDALDALGLRVRMGYETEWAALRPGPDGPRPAFDGPAYGMTRLVDAADYLRDIALALRDQDVCVLQLHPEYAPGQFEVSTAPAAPLDAADDVVLVRETIRAVGRAHATTASFAPVITPGGVGNGCHLHFSLERDGTDLLRGAGGPCGTAPEGEAFLAGVLRSLPALLAVAVPSPAGYERLAPSRWAGAFRCWGPENREAALRLVTAPPTDPGGAHAEVKCADADANPYLLAAAVLAAGAAGVRDDARLPPPVHGDPAAVPGAPRLPRDLTGAVGHFTADAVLRDALGPVLHDAVVAVRRAQVEEAAAQEAGGDAAGPGR